MLTGRRNLLIGFASAAALPACAVGQTAEITPEAFGAKGDGRTNDTDAFAAMSDFVSARGGGTIVLRQVTYIVGRTAHPGNSAQSAKTGIFGFPPARIMQFNGCSGLLLIHGNGARLQAAEGLRFGAFEPGTGRRVDRPLPFTRREFRAAPYIAMIEVQGCTGIVDIRDLELDGNLGAFQIGGKWGDVGWQIPGAGIRLIGNSGPERLSRIHTHHHPLDGLTIIGPSERTAASILSDVVADSNGRQGCSFTAGRNYVFEHCRFTRTGRGGVSSGPGAGVDLEAQPGFAIRNVRFAHCEFSDNAGAALVADSGDSAGIFFDACNFVGTTHWSAWPNKPHMRFKECTFVGAIVHAFGATDAVRAAQFYDCRFSDDPALSPTGEVYGGGHQSQPIAVLPTEKNVLFSGCDFSLIHRCALPFTSRVIFADCNMSQRSPATARPVGTYLGRNTIKGNADLAGSTIRGEVILNGRRLPRAA